METKPTLRDAELAHIIALVYDRSGISLHEGKRGLIAARLDKRLLALGLNDYGAYLDQVNDDDTGAELTSLLDAITTNQTSFFREPQHFVFLRERVVPALAERAGSRCDVWCAASSSGEEPLTIAISLREAGLTEFDLLASDISTRALGVAQAAVYPVESLSSLSRNLLKRYFEKGLGSYDGLARAGADLRRHIHYQRLNLIAMEPLGRQFDVIFCRNVMIYFDCAVRQRVVTMLESYLKPGGYLFVSHSENLHGIVHGLTPVSSSVYRRRG